MSKEFNSTNKIDAGRFSTWLSDIRESIRNNTTISVPCGDCKACCTSSLFIHIGKEETETIEKIDNKLLFEDPNKPAQNFILGFTQNGHCPMFENNNCSIYEFRPKTCRIFDCRIFTATGLAVDDYLKEDISNQCKRWKFSYPTKEDEEESNALQSTVNFIQQNSDLFPKKRIPQLKSELAILSIKVYKVFLRETINSDSIEFKKSFIVEILDELDNFSNLT